MASAYSSRLSQKLAFARMHLHLWQQAEEAHALQSAAMVQSLRESTLFHGVSVYHVFLQELANFHGIKTNTLITLEALEAQLLIKERISPEVNEIKNLLSDRNSWLSELLMHYEQCLIVQEVIEPKPVDVTKEVAIPVMMIHVDEKPLLTSTECEHLLNHLRDYINRVHESTMSEW